MNQHSPIATLPPGTTMAAETMPRRAWTVAEIEAMVAAGIIAEDERFELIGGEVVPMSPKGAAHDWIKKRLTRHLHRTLPDDLTAYGETTLRLDAHSFIEPDFCICPPKGQPETVVAAEVLLAIEVADTSLRYDTGRKIEIHAQFGIPEVWVVNARTLETRTYRDLGEEGYRTLLTYGLDEEVAATKAPVAVRLSALGLSSSTQTAPD